MIKKIEEPGDLVGFEIGTRLTKYPISGEYAEQVDFTDNSNLLEYEIHLINKDTQMVGLKIPDINVPQADTLAGGNEVTGIEANPLVLNKSFEDLITDKVWWYEQ
jgi:hypothetical protein